MSITKRNTAKKTIKTNKTKTIVSTPEQQPQPE